MLELFYWFLAEIAQHTYGGIVLIMIISGLGVPLPEDLIVMAVGVLASQGWLNPVGGLICCYFSVLLSDFILLSMGGYFGSAVLKRRWMKRKLHPRRLRWAHRQMHRHGAWMILASRFIPGSRTATLLTSGSMRIRRWKFALADGTGLLISVPIQFALGWMFARSIPTLMEHRWQAVLGLACMGVILLIAYALWRWGRWSVRLKRRAQAAPPQTRPGERERLVDDHSHGREPVVAGTSNALSPDRGD